ncbi:Beta-adrenergic receptor kinase 1 [Taenia crassiceps]|uniref:Beta-adrenergic receptor kinase 1 n=1 Tax=Taenia crassiceps TaxID=6207 RepID=A0ABR4Q690_9CEST
MQTGEFDVVKFISRGSYTLVYELCCPMRSSRAPHPSETRQKEEAITFLVTLIESCRIRGAPAFVLHKGSGLNLWDLVTNVGYLGENDMRFYSCEIICGLEHLHAMRIVHLDVKPYNILIADSGHILITDFDHSYDMSQETGPPKKTDFTGTPFFMAPEIKDGLAITTRADIWSLGVLVACIMYGYATALDWLGTRRFMKGHLPNVSTPLRKFFKACLTHNYNKRLNIDGVKRLEFYKDVNWREVIACKLEPPYRPFDLEVFAAKKKCNFDPFNPLLVAGAYDAHMPLIERRLRDIRDKYGVRRLMVVSPNYKDLARAKLTAERIAELFSNFDFINTHLLHPYRKYHGEQANFDSTFWLPSFWEILEEFRVKVERTRQNSSILRAESDAIPAAILALRPDNLGFVFIR